MLDPALGKLLEAARIRLLVLFARDPLDSARVFLADLLEKFALLVISCAYNPPRPPHVPFIWFTTSRESPQMTTSLGSITSNRTQRSTAMKAVHSATLLEVCGPWPR